MNKDCKILLVTDKRDSFSEVVKSVHVKISDFEVADDDSGMINCFESMHPDIIIFYHSTIETSVKSYMYMHKNSKVMSTFKHRAIVMCDGEVVLKAVEKCLDNVFFDYLVFNPDFDRLRINLLIYKALESISNDVDSNKNRDFARLGNTLCNQSKDVFDSISDITKVSDVSQKELDIVSDKLKSNINKYSSSLISNNSKPSMSDLELRKAVEEFSRKNIVDSINQSKKVVNSEIDRVKARLEKNKKKYEATLSQIEELSSTVSVNVLLVEDSDLYAEMVSTMLEKTGNYKVKVTTSIHQSMLYLMHDKPDVILLDYELDDGDAGDFLEQLADISIVKNTPVIMLTSHATNDVYTTTSMMGASAFIKKPANKEIIISKIEKVLA